MKKSHIVNVILVGAIIFFANTVYAQKWSLSGSLFGGKVLKHKQDILFEVPPLSSAFIFSAVNQTNGSKVWHKYWRNPRIEIQISGLNFGNDKILGQAYAVIPGYTFYLKRFKKIDFLFHIGMGIGYLTKKFDIQNNPDNNAIGSHLNNATRFRISGNYQIDPKWQIEAGINFLHFSNALSASPNSGINVYGPDIGIRYLFNTQKQDDINSTTYESVPAYNKWGWNIQFGWAKNEKHIPGGPKFLIYTISNSAVYHFSPYLRMYLGYEFEMNNATYFSTYFIFEDKDLATQKAKSHILFTAVEMLFGRTGLRVQLGHYPGRNLFQNSEAIYLKLNINVYGNTLYKGRAIPYIGLLLKSHFTVAEYFAIVGGIDI